MRFVCSASADYATMHAGKRAGCPALKAARDGVSFLSALKGKVRSRGPIFWHYPHYGNQGGSPGAAIRDGDWSLIEFFVDNHLELYNLKDDLGEERALAAESPGRVKKLRERLHAWQKEVVRVSRRRIRVFKPAPQPSK